MGSQKIRYLWYHTTPRYAYVPGSQQVYAITCYIWRSPMAVVPGPPSSRGNTVLATSCSYAAIPTDKASVWMGFFNWGKRTALVDQGLENNTDLVWPWWPLQPRPVVPAINGRGGQPGETEAGGTRATSTPAGRRDDVQDATIPGAPSRGLVTNP